MKRIAVIVSVAAVYVSAAAFPAVRPAFGADAGNPTGGRLTLNIEKRKDSSVIGMDYSLRWSRMAVV